MKPLAIDFARAHFKHRPRLKRFSLLTQALCLIGSLLLLIVIWECWSLKEEEAHLLANIRQLETSVPPSTPVHAKAALALSAEKTDALNAAIEKLNLPWRDLLNAIEQSTPKNIALLSLEPDPTKNLLMIQAESADPDSMLDYVSQLKQQALFLDVRLLKHEISKQDPYAPYRFQIEAHWKEETP